MVLFFALKFGILRKNAYLCTLSKDKNVFD